MQSHAHKSFGITVEHRDESGATVIRFLDRNLTFYVAEAVRDEVVAAVHQARTAGDARVLLDLSEVAFIDSGGVGLVITALNQASTINLRLGLFGVAPFLDQVFDVMRLKRHLSVFATENEALSVTAA